MLPKMKLTVVVVATTYVKISMSSLSSNLGKYVYSTKHNLGFRAYLNGTLCRHICLRKSSVTFAYT